MFKDIKDGITGISKGSKRQTITSVGEDVDKLEPFYIASGIVKWCIPFGKPSGNSSNC